MKLSGDEILALAALVLCAPVAYSWGTDGHFITCRLAQSRLSKEVADIVSEILPAHANGDLDSLCLWPDEIKRQSQYRWSSALHFVNTSDTLCNYEYNKDCKDASGEKVRCVVAAIHNYTDQLLGCDSAYSKSQYNLTEALLFLSHFFGDIHQPLHVGFLSDRGGNAIDVEWYSNKSNLHHVWDDNIIEKAEEMFSDSNVEELINTLRKNITTVWADQAEAWEDCSDTSCPDAYASEGIKAACDWAYKGVSNGSVRRMVWMTFADDYYLSLNPVVNMRLAQGGIRLAAALNRIFGSSPPLYWSPIWKA